MTCVLSVFADCYRLVKCLILALTWGRVEGEETRRTLRWFPRTEKQLGGGLCMLLIRRLAVSRCLRPGLALISWAGELRLISLVQFRLVSAGNMGWISKNKRAGFHTKVLELEDGVAVVCLQWSFPKTGVSVTLIQPPTHLNLVTSSATPLGGCTPDIILITHRLTTPHYYLSLKPVQRIWEKRKGNQREGL